MAGHKMIVSKSMYVFLQTKTEVSVSLFESSAQLTLHVLRIINRVVVFVHDFDWRQFEGHVFCVRHLFQSEIEFLGRARRSQDGLVESCTCRRCRHARPPTQTTPDC